MKIKEFFEWYKKELSVLAIVLLLGCLTSCNINKKSEEKINIILHELAEESYFLGQRDAIEGDIRIEYKYSCDCWIWIKSPWDDGKEPIVNSYPNK